ncbi:MAG: hypothetical protein ACQEQL_07100, partial [Pseudomonadota bacterium]
VYNLKSMGAKSGLVNASADYHKLYAPGHMWCEVLEGEHLSTDVAVKNGQALWFAHAKGIPTHGGMFDYWEILDQAHPQTETYITRFIEDHFSAYSGMMNFETIGGRIIEIHLRFADQWPDLYGDGFVKNLIDLYNPDRPAAHFESIKKKGYSVVLFLPHKQYEKPDFRQVESFIDGDHITSIQFSFDPSLAHTDHSMPPGGFRVAIINGFDKEACLDVRETLKTFPEFSI